MSQHQAFRRVAIPAQVALKVETITFPAPTRGLVLTENESYMQPGAAVVMDNWKPTLKGAAIRGGCKLWAQLPEATPVISAFRYASGTNHKMFFANATKVYDVSTSTPVLVKSGQLNGNYSTSQLANASGDHLIAVNDAGDFPIRFNGTTWTTLDAGQITASGPDATNVALGKNLVHVCKYRNRWFFIELNSMNAWYLPLNATQGVLNVIPLSGAATKGGKLLYCAAWSIDAGDGIDDKIVFGTDLGEIIVFTGSDPASAANWRQEGRYDMSPPMGKNATQSIGGDLLVACVDGILPTSGAITKDRAELELAAITRQIKPLWRTEVLEKREWAWTMCKWDEYGGLFVSWPGGKPGKQLCAVANLATGAWCRFTGWDATCFAKMRGDMFFGTQTGKIQQADRTGYDDGMPYTCTIVGGWEVFQSPSQTITWKQARASFSARAGEPFVPQLGATLDYVVALPTPPSAAPDPGLLDLWDQGLWGPGVTNYGTPWQHSHAYTVGNRAFVNRDDGYWDCAVAHTSAASGMFEDDRTANPTYWTFASPQPTPPVPTTIERDRYAQWDGDTPSKPVVRNTGWVSIGMTGFSHAPIVQVTMAQNARPEVELISIAGTFERLGITV